MTFRGQRLVSHLLASGNIRGYNGSDQLEAGRVRPQTPGTVEINRTTAIGSLFNSATELPKTLLHEGRHTEQLQGIQPGQAAAAYISANKKVLEDDAYQFEAANYVP